MNNTLEIAEKLRNGEKVSLPAGITEFDVARMQAHENYIQQMQLIKMQEELSKHMRKI